jgi:hypothetical protein
MGSSSIELEGDGVGENREIDDGDDGIVLKIGCFNFGGQYKK